MAERYVLRIEVWTDQEDPICSFTAYEQSGEYRVAIVQVGPFDTVADVLKAGYERLTGQQSLW